MPEVHFGSNQNDKGRILTDTAFINCIKIYSLRQRLIETTPPTASRLILIGSGTFVYSKLATVATVATLLDKLKITKLHSRPYVSDDNPYSKAL